MTHLQDRGTTSNQHNLQSVSFLAHLSCDPTPCNRAADPNDSRQSRLKLHSQHTHQTVSYLERVQLTDLFSRMFSVTYGCRVRWRSQPGQTTIPTTAFLPETFRFQYLFCSAVQTKNTSTDLSYLNTNV